VPFRSRFQRQADEAQRVPKIAWDAAARGRLRDQLEAGIRAKLDDLRSADEVIVGPFTGEVGFELLYWIPFVRWVANELDLRGRLVVVSRGGAAQWLDGLDARHADVLTWCTDDELRAAKPMDKQREITPFEEKIYDRVKRELRMRNPKILHPMTFFAFYQGYLKLDARAFSGAVGQTPTGATGRYAAYERLHPPEIAGLDLPDDFVAVRFYSRLSFPDTADNRRFGADVVRTLASRTDVVLLDSPVRVDEHRDLSLRAAGVESVAHLMTPDTNLAVQSAVIARAKAFVGTYGGLSYLAPFLGVPAIAFSSDPGHVLSWHYDLARRVFDGEAWGALVELRPRDLELLDLLVAPAVGAGS
jgi:hypothetical protein